MVCLPILSFRKTHTPSVKSATEIHGIVLCAQPEVVYVGIIDLVDRKPHDQLYEVVIEPP